MTLGTLEVIGTPYVPFLRDRVYARTVANTLTISISTEISTDFLYGLRDIVNIVSNNASDMCPSMEQTGRQSIPGVRWFSTAALCYPTL